ncbi:aminotransferase class I/II-fold pyridoxal phosphate-dependent enzyme [Corynebacterium heidelbergense]|uniref:Aminotransferase n=1 Tax=Corynebacterium heidelbergense TaxID=2055947 RepID=A0A364VAV0_9CORY|nr:aminotransferase class I/II-fold pyridoxal phosphate-dependent enzyme [Corynebacterium heidelbergense]RAV33741.1 aminotransferase [Corynebacterium heidelbergense]WCZ36432.1 putative N-succinyldiaminopimelate aminotransferase DapC [Corynebacterium heidelbergense]
MHNRGVNRLRHYGETIFATMSALAAETGSINLGQGAPDFPAPRVVLEEAQHQIAIGNNQYAPGRGTMELRSAITDERARRTGQHFDPRTECLVTVGATEAIAAAVIGLVEPGERVVIVEPYYDSYEAAISLAGARRTTVALRPDARGNWRLDPTEIRNAIMGRGEDDRAAMIIINSPHNPTGAILSAEELSAIAAAARDAGALVLSDEVYERLVFDGASHHSISESAGMRERTIVASSAGKTFNITGWKTGWALAPEPLIEAILRAKQFMTYAGAAPMQPAVTVGLNECDGGVGRLRDTLQLNRDALVNGLRDLGAEVCDPHAGYFAVADVSSWNLGDAPQAVHTLAYEAGVVGIPVTAFVDDPGNPIFSSLVRFSFCKDRGAVEEALRRLDAYLRR